MKSFSTRVLSVVLLSAPWTCSAEDLLIRDVTLVSPERETPLLAAHVLMRDGRIAARSSTTADRRRRRRGDRRSGRYPGPRPDRQPRPPRPRHRPQAPLHAGLRSPVRAISSASSRAASCTSATPRWSRTTAIPPSIASSMRRRCIRAARTAARCRCPTTSWPPTSTRPRTSARPIPNFLHDRHTHADVARRASTRPTHTPAVTVDAHRRQRRALRQALLRGGAVVAGTASAPQFSLPSLAILREVVAAAHARGLTVLMHGNTPAAHRIGLEAGIDVMAHGLWDWAGATHGHADIPDDVLATADAVAASAMRVQPTWMAAAGMTSMFDPDSLSDPAARDACSAADYLDLPARPRPAGARRLPRAASARRSPRPMRAARPRPTSRRASSPSISTRYRRILQRQHAGRCQVPVRQRHRRRHAGLGQSAGAVGLSRDAGLGRRRHRPAHGAARGDARQCQGLRTRARDSAASRSASAPTCCCSRPIRWRRVEAYDRIEQVILGGQVIERDTLAADAPAPVGVSTLAVPRQGRRAGFTATAVVSRRSPASSRASAPAASVPAISPWPTACRRYRRRRR